MFPDHSDDPKQSTDCRVSVSSHSLFKSKFIRIDLISICFRLKHFVYRGNSFTHDIQNPGSLMTQILRNSDSFVLPKV